MKIKIYTTPACPWCTIAKEFFKKNKIDFEEIDVSENQEKAQEMIAKSGQMSVPVIDIEGEIIVGFNEEKIKAALKNEEERRRRRWQNTK